MGRIYKHKPRETSRLTRAERFALYTALTTSVVSALLTPAVVYFWLDPTEKDYENRGRLVQLTSTFDDYLTPEIFFDGKRPIPLHTSAVLVNVGRRPIRNLELYVAVPTGSNDESTAVAGRPLERTRETTDFIVYSVSGSVAPGEKIEVTHVSTDPSVAIRTEHGDSLQLQFRIPPHRLEFARKRLAR